MVSRSCLSCGAVIPASVSRCEDCQRALWRAQPGREARGYTRKWRTISTKVRRKSPLCALRLPGCTLVATQTDHIVPVTRGGTSSYANAQPSCGPCNQAKKALDRERYPSHA